MSRKHRPHTDNGTDFYCKWCHVELGKMASFNYRPLPNIPGSCPKAPPPWDLWRINQSLLDSIRAHYGTEPFTNKDAYVIYAVRHATPYAEKQSKLHPDYIFHPGNPKDPMLQMNVRNTLCKAAYPGIDILIRLGPGHYKFPEE